jgi:hypothetical protein
MTVLHADVEGLEGVPDVRGQWVGIFMEVQQLRLIVVDGEGECGQLLLQALEGGQHLGGGAQYVQVVDEGEVGDATGAGQVDQRVVDVETEEERAEGISLSKTIGGVDLLAVALLYEEG